MRRKLYKRIVAVTLAAMTIAGSAVFIGRSTRTKAGDGRGGSDGRRTVLEIFFPASGRDCTTGLSQVVSGYL